MNSPITGKKMEIKMEVVKLTFRKEIFPVVKHFYYCNDSKESFTTTEQDEVTLRQLHNKYREKHNIPFPDEITKIREQYKLSASKMSDILGFGINNYRQYEAGEIPSLSNSKLIQLAKDPLKFLSLVEICDTISDADFKIKLVDRIYELIEDNSNIEAKEFEHYVFNHKIPSQFTGYRTPNLNKMTEMVVFFTEKFQPWKTQINKLMFYADFLHYKREGYSISGSSYRAIGMGPVPNNYQTIYEYIANKDEIDIYYIEFENGSSGENFKPRIDRKFSREMFNDSEINILEIISERFKGISTHEIIEMSHNEIGWIHNEPNRGFISYDYGFSLKQF